MVQERHPLSKAFTSEIVFEMQKKFKMVVTVNFIHFSLRWFSPVKVSFEKCVLMLYFFLKEVKLKKNNNSWSP
jgi:hypothetical protein